MKRYLTTLIISLLSLSTVAFTSTINIPADYATIQGGIDASVDGDTIIVNNGTYYENVYVDKQLTFLSVEGADSTIIDGNGSCRKKHYYLWLCS